MKKDLITLLESSYVSEEFPYTWEEGKEFLSDADFRIARSLGLVSDRPPIDWGKTFFDTSNTCFLMSIALCCAVLMGSLLISSSAVRVVCFCGCTILGVAATKEIEIKRGGVK